MSLTASIQEFVRLFLQSVSFTSQVESQKERMVHVHATSKFNVVTSNDHSVMSRIGMEKKYSIHVWSSNYDPLSYASGKFEQ